MTLAAAAVVLVVVVVVAVVVVVVVVIVRKVGNKVPSETQFKSHFNITISSKHAKDCVVLATVLRS